MWRKLVSIGQWLLPLRLELGTYETYQPQETYQVGPFGYSLATVMIMSWVFHLSQPTRSTLSRPVTAL